MVKSPLDDQAIAAALRRVLRATLKEQSTGRSGGGAGGGAGRGAADPPRRGRYSVQLNSDATGRQIILDARADMARAAEARRSAQAVMAATQLPSPAEAARAARAERSLDILALAVQQTEDRVFRGMGKEPPR